MSCVCELCREPTERMVRDDRGDQLGGTFAHCRNDLLSASARLPRRSSPLGLVSRSCSSSAIRDPTGAVSVIHFSPNADRQELIVGKFNTSPRRCGW
jgi:hypothetical protein